MSESNESRRVPETEDELRAVIRAELQSVLEATDEEVQEALRKRGYNPSQVALEVKNVLLEAVLHRLQK
jgi:broad-specificity NMP kinase